MSTYLQIIYQVVFSTKRRNPCLIKENRRILYEYFYGVLKERKCHTYRINGIEDHTHFIFSLHPSHALSEVVKSLKHAGTYIIKKEDLFKTFNGWQAGYGAFTYAINAKDRLIEYVKNQEEHHKRKTFLSEYERLLKEHNITFEKKFLL